MNLEEEMRNQFDLIDTGATLQVHRGDDGMIRARANPMPYLRSPMRQAKPQSLEQTVEELPAVVGGLAGGATAATVGLPGDIAGLAAGAYKALYPDEGEGRLEAFTNTLTDISDKYGSGAVKGYLRDQAEQMGASDVQMEALEEAMTVGEFGGVGGIAKGVATKGPQMLSKAGDVIEGAGEGAKARMAEGGVTLGAGVDPDPLIAAAGDAVKSMRGGVSEIKITKTTDVSDTFGQGAKSVTYTDPQSGGFIEVVQRKDGPTSVLALEVPEQFRGSGIGQKLQAAAMADNPELQGQVSSKAAAVGAYRLGRRPVSNPDATLNEVFDIIDEQSSVLMKMPEQLGVAAAGDAVKAARARYEASPNDPAARRAYLDARHERDAQLSSMPVEEKLETDVSYRMMHQPTTPQDGAARLDDMTGGGTVFPDDIYSGDAVRLYGGNNPADQESAKIIQSVRGNPEAEVTIYRAVPKDVNTINPGDWVTLSKSYADDHAESGYGQMGDEAGKVISQKIKVKDVYSDGNDLNEFGYFPEDIAETNVAKLEPPTEKQPGVIAFHGSGADFDEFSLEKIGTGTKATQYGHGLYFSDYEDVATYFRGLASSPVADYKLNGGSVTDMYNKAQDAGDYEKAEVLEQVLLHDRPDQIAERFTVEEGYSPETEEFAKSINYDTLKGFDPDGNEVSLGRTYKTELGVDAENMLDWQTPLKDQPQAIKEKVRSLVNDDLRETFDYNVEKGIVGGNAYLNYIGKNKKEASEKLAEAGLDGIKYKDIGGTLGYTLENAPTNYVVFKPEAIKILEKYGIVGPVAITGIAASQQEGEGDGRSA